MREKKTKMPEDFQVSPRMIELAKQNGWPDPRKELEVFKDHHLANGSLMADWEAAFRTWLRRAVEFKGDKSKVYTKDPKPIKSREDRPKESGPFDPRVSDLLQGLVKKLGKND